MRLYKILVPTVLALSLIGCGSSDGKVEMGGKQETEQEKAIECLASAASSTVSTADNYLGFTCETGDLKLGISSGGNEVNFNLSKFRASGAFDLKNQKASIAVPSLEAGLSYKIVDSEAESNKANSKDLKFRFADAGIYITDNTLYLDLSNNNLTDLVDLYISEYMGIENDGSNSVYNAMYQTIKQQLGTITSKLRLKMESPIDFSGYVPSEEAKEELNQEYFVENITTFVNQYLDGAKEAGVELTFNDIIQVYTYANGRIGAQFTLNNDLYNKIVKGTNDSKVEDAVEGFDFGNSNLSIAIMTDANKCISSLSFSAGLSSEFGEEEKTKISFNTNFKFTVNFNEQTLSMPESFSNYYEVSEFSRMLSGVKLGA